MLANNLAASRKWHQQTRTLFANSLSGSYSWCVRRGIVDFNPARLVPRVRGAKLNNLRRYVPTS